MRDFVPQSPHACVSLFPGSHSPELGALQEFHEQDELHVLVPEPQAPLQPVVEPGEQIPSLWQEPHDPQLQSTHVRFFDPQSPHGCV